MKSGGDARRTAVSDDANVPSLEPAYGSNSFHSDRSAKIDRSRRYLPASRDQGQRLVADDRALGWTVARDAQVALGPEPGQLLPALPVLLERLDLRVVHLAVLAAVRLEPSRRLVVLDLVEDRVDGGLDLGSLRAGEL